MTAEDCGHTNLTGYHNEGCRSVTCRDRASRARGYTTRRPSPQPSDYTGRGVLRCVWCGQPYTEHSILERCR